MDENVNDILRWLFSSWDSNRPHQIDFGSQWHARMMFLAWGILLPCGILMARFFKITPKQNFPHELDNQLWWYSHVYLQAIGCIISFLSLLFILYYNSHNIDAPLHRLLGWATMILCSIQILLGQFRGTKGGPTYPAPDGSWRGDHYDMTTYRYVFEYIHKILGYVTLLCSWGTTLSGLWYVNAPKGMVLFILLFWAGLISIFVFLQRQGRAVDTYQAIWGTDPKHPGNTKKIVGWRIKRQPHTKDYEIKSIHQKNFNDDDDDDDDDEY